MKKSKLETLDSAIHILEKCRLAIQESDKALMEVLGMGCKSISQLEFDQLKQSINDLSNISTKVRTYRNQLIFNMDKIELALFNDSMQKDKNKSEISDTEEIEKVRRKIPNWRKHPRQINHKILDSYLQLNKEKELITVQELQDYCAKNYKILGGKFFQNYAQMKMKAKKNQGKVFEEIQDTQDTYVTLWQPVAEFIKQQWEQ